jgi:hypothetical protein
LWKNETLNEYRAGDANQPEEEVIQGFFLQNEKYLSARVIG